MITELNWGTARKHRSDTVSDSPIGVLSDDNRQDAQDNEPKGMLIQNTSSNAIRVTFDGTTPTDSLGIRLVNTMDPIYVPGLSNIKNCNAIREGGSDGELERVLFY